MHGLPYFRFCGCGAVSSRRKSTGPSHVPKARTHECLSKQATDTPIREWVVRTSFNKSTKAPRTARTGLCVRDRTAVQHPSPVPQSMPRILPLERLGCRRHRPVGPTWGSTGTTWYNTTPLCQYRTLSPPSSRALLHALILSIDVAFKLRMVKSRETSQDGPTACAALAGGMPSHLQTDVEHPSHDATKDPAAMQRCPPSADIQESHAEMLACSRWTRTPAHTTPAWGYAVLHAPCCTRLCRTGPETRTDPYGPTHV